MSPSNSVMDATIFQDVSRSVDQLCNQMSLVNVKIPRYNSCSDVFEFIAEFETATIGLGDEQRHVLLNKAFPPGCHRPWYETELKPLIEKKSPWQNLKNQIINRFSATEDRDRHIARIRELKFDPDGRQNLLDFVEELLYSYKKAFPSETSPDSCIRYVKAAMPQSVRSTLSVNPDFREATTEEKLKKSVQQYDVSRSTTTIAKPNDRLVSQELASLLKELMASVNKQGEATRSAIVAALQTNSNYHQERYNSDRYERNKSPPRNNYPTRRTPSPVYQRRRSPSPNYYRQRNISPSKVYELKAESSKDYNQPIKDGKFQVGEHEEAFSSKAYYARFGKPPTPCGNCNYWHWSRHCHNHLN